MREPRFEIIGFAWSQMLGPGGVTRASMASRITAETVFFFCRASRTTLAADSAGRRIETSCVPLFV